MRLLVECTYVFEHPNDNSGIQRVVRNIIKHLGELEGEIDCIPVMMQGGRVYQVLSLAPLRARRLPRISQLRVRLEHWRNRYWYLHARRYVGHIRCDACCLFYAESVVGV